MTSFMVPTGKSVEHRRRSPRGGAPATFDGARSATPAALRLPIVGASAAMGLHPTGSSPASS